MKLIDEILKIENHFKDVNEDDLLKDLKTCGLNTIDDPETSNWTWDRDIDTSTPSNLNAKEYISYEYDVVYEELKRLLYNINQKTKD
jgi:hypothetical protein